MGETEEVLLIGLTGRAGSGKDTCADALVQRRDFIKVSLADPIKRICADLFGWDDATLWGPSALRNVPDARWGGLTPRRALQHLGTEFGRGMHPDVWVKRLLRDFDARQDCVVSDVRFPNEVAAIRAAGGRIVRIVRPGSGLDGAAGAHASEQGVFDVDLELPNNAELWLLQARAVKLPGVLFGGQPFDLEAP